MKIKKVDEIWKQYTFQDGSVSVHIGYNDLELKYNVMLHGEVTKVRDVKVRRIKRS